MCLKIFCVITAGKGNAEKSLTGLADIKSLHHTSGRFHSCHDQDASLRTTELFFRIGNFTLHKLYILCAFCFRDTDGITSTGNRAADIFFPVRAVQAVDPDYPFTSTIVNCFQCMIQGKTCRVFLVLCYCVF